MRLAFAAFLALLAFPPGVRPAAGAETKAFITCTDFTTGSLSAVSLTTRAVSQDVASINSDAVERWYGGQLYVVNRFGADNVQVINPATYATVHQWSTGNGSNPYDIAFTSPAKAYVTLYGRNSLLIMNPQTGATLGSISLAAFADADGLPEMDHMIRVDRWLFVSLQRLDEAHGFVPTDYSLVVVIDTQTDTVVDADPATPGVQGIKLVNKNPVTAFAFDRASTRLFIGCVGAYGVNDGGIEAIDPVHFEALGNLITEAQLGGDVGGFAWNGDAHSYAIVVDAASNTSLRAWSALTHATIGAPLFAPGGFSLTDLALNDRGELYLCDSDFLAPGLHVFSTANDAHLAGPLDTGLPPYHVTFDQASSEVLAAAPDAPVTALSAPWPNPAREGAHFELRLTRAEPVTVEVIDLAGRRVATLASGERPAGAGTLSWDLAGDDGRRVAPGIYLVRARAASFEATRRVVVMH